MPFVWWLQWYHFKLTLNQFLCSLVARPRPLTSSSLDSLSLIWCLNSQLQDSQWLIHSFNSYDLGKQAAGFVFDEDLWFWTVLTIMACQLCNWLWLAFSLSKNSQQSLSVDLMTPCSGKLDPFWPGWHRYSVCFKLLDSNVWTLYASLSSLL